MNIISSRALALVASVFFLCNTASFSQIGIGTTTPDASAILDIDSETQGVLVPRMNTIQRDAIASPAESLLVYDTDEGEFYFFNGGSWNPLEGALQRDNYKLIKSAADLSDELLAGGGTEYILNTETLYEINGTITLTLPINLNNAYIYGADTNEDVLVNSGNTLFSGATGGSIRRLTLSAPGGTVFDLTDAGTENLIFRDCIVANSNSVGTISGYNLVFLSVIQYANNSNGIIYNNINQLLLNSTGWDSNNAGTYETFTGTFDILTKQGGFCHVTGATAALDITGMTSITGGATLRLVDFYGGGNYINGSSPYSGYNFSNDWDVNSPGIRVETDEVAFGNVYISTAAQTEFSASNTPTKLAGTTTAVNLFRTQSLENNRITYVGKKNRNFSYSATLSFTSGNNLIFNFYIYKNGTQLLESKQSRKVSNGGDVGNVTLTGMVNMSENDYVEVWVENTTNTDEFDTASMNFTLR